MRIQKQYQLEKLDELWCIDWRYGDVHREMHFFLEKELGIEPSSIESNNLWSILRTIQTESKNASAHTKTPQTSATSENQGKG